MTRTQLMNTVRRRMHAIAPLFRACLLLACLSPVIGAHAAAAQDVSVGKRFVLHSQILGEDREVLVHLPPGYDIARKRYPVLFLLDGNNHFAYASGILDFLSRNERTPEIILVAVPTMHKRIRDLTAPLLHDAKSIEEYKENPVGGASNFARYLADELAPWVDAHYRTEPYRILSGHSFGGLFNFRTLLERPDAFQAHIAVSPSLWWDDRATVKLAKEKLAALPGSQSLYFSWGDDEETIRDSSQDMMDWLRENEPKGLTWKQRYYPGDDHGTTPLRTLYDGLEWLYADWPLVVRKREDKDYATLVALSQQHYAMLSKKFGYPIEPTAGTLYELTGWLMEKKRYDEALVLARSNTAKYPEVGAVYWQTGEILEKLDRPKEALAAYRRSTEFPGEYDNVWEIERKLAELKKKAAVAGAK